MWSNALNYWFQREQKKREEWLKRQESLVRPGQRLGYGTQPANLRRDLVEHQDAIGFDLHIQSSPHLQPMQDELDMLIQQRIQRLKQTEELNKTVSSLCDILKYHHQHILSCPPFGRSISNIASTDLYPSMFLFFLILPVADGGLEIWGGHDMRRDLLHYIQNINTQIIICTAKSLVDLFLCKSINWFVKPCGLTLSVGSWGSPFQLIHNPVLRAVLESWNSSKKCYTIQTRKASFRGSSLQVGIRRTGFLYGSSVLNIKTEQASFLIGWTAVTMVTIEELVSIAYLKTAVSFVDQLYYYKFFIRSVAVALSVINVEIRKTTPVSWAWTFSYSSQHPEWILLLFC